MLAVFRVKAKQMTKDINVELSDDGLGLMRLQRAPVNALTAASMAETGDVMAETAAADSVG